MRDEELVFDRTCHVVYSEACKKEIQEKIALHYPSGEQENLWMRTNPYSKDCCIFLFPWRRRSAENGMITK